MVGLWTFTSADSVVFVVACIGWLLAIAIVAAVFRLMPKEDSHLIKATAAMIAILPLAWYAFDRWQNYTDPQGESNDSCIKVDLPAARSHSDMVATAHNTVCGVMGGSSAIYVYVHRLGESDDRKNLVFRFFDSFEAAAPTIVWTDDSSLLVSVSHVSQITKQIYALDGIKLRYKVGKIDYPDSVFPMNMHHVRKLASR